MKHLGILLVLVLAGRFEAWSQGCSVCTQTANNLGESGANGLNMGIIYLAMLPLAFIGVLTFVWFKYNRQSNS